MPGGRLKLDSWGGEEHGEEPTARIPAPRNYGAVGAGLAVL